MKYTLLFLAVQFIGIAVWEMILTYRYTEIPLLDHFIWIVTDTVSITIIFAAIFSLIAWIDWHKRVIWHALTIPATGGAVALSAWLPAGRWELGVIGLFGCGGFVGGIWLFSRWWFGIGRFGFGDVMLAGCIGAVFGIVHGLWVIAAGILLAGGYAGIQLWRGADREHIFGYGTFLALSAVAALLG